MPERLINYLDYLGDIQDVLPPHWSCLAITLAAVFCGALIGIERESADKPAGMRTLILICLGSAIFTQMSVLLVDGGAGDRSRVAAQIVSGIGFLGAGAILRERGLVLGVTTGAGIWATAAVGMVVGGGYIAAGLLFSCLILGTLAGANVVEHLVKGRCRMRPIRLSVRGDDDAALLRVQSVLDSYSTGIRARVTGEENGCKIVEFQYCESHRDHRAFVGKLLELPAIERVMRA